MDSVEAQLARLTAQVEQTSNRLSQLEARTAVASAAAAVPAATPAPAPAAADSNLSAMTGGASAPRPKPEPHAAPAASGPSAQRLAAVRAIEKPSTNDAGDDEYNYGYRLWDAKFYPEAEQQLKMYVERYPHHARISFARNLLGRAYLDDGKPREAASWFLQNYQADKNGARAADSLLLLAESMRQLQDTGRACIALAEFSEKYAIEAAGRLKSQYDATRAGVKCNK
jgi:TolA-binding protein